MSISLSSTVEDILNLKKNEIQSFLRSVNAKLTGTKHELAQRAYEKLSGISTFVIVIWRRQGNR
jgi:hypothetical protein